MKKTLLLTIIALANNLVFSQIDIQGHRGARGLYPENSIEGFIHALQLGVNTLEMDVVISADGKVVVSHDPYINATFCTDTAGHTIEKSKEKDFNIYKMTYNQIKKCDCGSVPHPNFPNQKKLKTYKPLLSEVMDTVEAFIRNNGFYPVKYNIETKSEVALDNIYQPEPSVFVEALMAVIKDKKIEDRVIIQSFDKRTIEYLHQKYPNIKTALLTVFSAKAKKEIKHLNFIPNILSPNYRSVNRRLVLYCKKNKIELIPWTVNNEKAMKRMIKLNVDGIITDYPNKLIELMMPIVNTK